MPPRDRRLPETLLCRWLLVLLLGLGRAKAADLRPPCLVHPTQEAQPKAKRASKTVCFPSRTSSSSWRPSCLRRQRSATTRRCGCRRWLARWSSSSRARRSIDRRLAATAASSQARISTPRCGASVCLRHSLALSPASADRAPCRPSPLVVSPSLMPSTSACADLGILLEEFGNSPGASAAPPRAAATAPLPPTRMSVPMAPRPPQLQGRPSAHAVPLRYAQRHPCDTVPEQYTVPSEPQFDPLPVSMPYQASLPAPPIPQQASMPMPMPHQASLPGPSGPSQIHSMSPFLPQALPGQPAMHPDPLIERPRRHEAQFPAAMRPFLPQAFPGQPHRDPRLEVIRQAFREPLDRPPTQGFNAPPRER